MTERSKWARYRDRKRGGPPRQLKPHGTVAAAMRHLRGPGGSAEMRACTIVGPDGRTCGQAWAEFQHEQYLRRKHRGK